DRKSTRLNSRHVRISYAVFCLKNKNKSPEQRAQGYYEQGMQLIAKKDDLGVRVALTTVIKFFFFNVTATTEIYTLSLHDALPILASGAMALSFGVAATQVWALLHLEAAGGRSEEHTSELQSRPHLVCRLLLE